MRGLAKSGAKKAMEMECRKASLARRLLEQNPRLVFGGQQIASAAKPTEGVVMQELRHRKIILPFERDSERQTHELDRLIAP